LGFSRISDAKRKKGGIGLMADKLSGSPVEKVLGLLHGKGLTHLKVTARTSNIVIYSEHGKEKENRCRFVKMQGNAYNLHMADHKGKWEPTPYTGTIDELVELITIQFGWALMDF
jgi:hypothetical protein